MTAKRTRRMWDDVLPAWDHAHHAALAGGATHGQMATLGGVLWLLARHQRTEDTIWLSQVAYHAGSWDGVGECPHGKKVAAGRALQALADMGAIAYQPSRHGSIVALPQPDPSRLTERDDALPQARPSARGRASSGASSRSTKRVVAPEWARGRASGGGWSRSTERASEEYPRGIPRRDPEGRAAHAASTNGYGDAHRTPKLVEVPAALWADPGEGDGDLITWAITQHPGATFVADCGGGEHIRFTVDDDGLHFDLEDHTP